MPTKNRSSNTEMVSELLPCPFCGQQDFLIERLDSDASVVICQGLTGPHEACLSRGPVGVAQDEGEEQPGRDKAVWLWNARAQQHQSEPIRLTAVGELQEDGDGGLEVQWLLEGGTAELEHGMLLLVAENSPELCSEVGSAEVHTHAVPGEVEGVSACDSNCPACKVLEYANALVAESEPANCTWTYSEATFAWDTACSASFMLTEDGPRENGMKFCPYCSKSIIQTPISEEVEVNGGQ
ncbi:Lar family restriction alleviation protein [Pseudomonas xanthosomatis]|uniref:Lar family restriction alleviation protein n=1 Tax=Pseudomonas xanthosomatis TaxID=2842356 RepID=UPI003516A91D